MKKLKQLSGVVLKNQNNFNFKNKVE